MNTTETTSLDNTCLHHHTEGLSPLPALQVDEQDAPQNRVLEIFL